jgi:hypothetical protein
MPHSGHLLSLGFQIAASSKPAQLIAALSLLCRTLDVSRTAVVYDIRNKRDAAHLADGIDPNLQDATFVVCVLDWVLAELIRLYHGVPANEATVIVDQIVARSAPVIQEFNGFQKVLRPSLKASDLVLLLLYRVGLQGADYDQLFKWVRPSVRPNLKRTLLRLVDDLAFAHFDGARYYVTRTGEQEIERRKLLSPD